MALHRHQRLYVSMRMLHQAIRANAPLMMANDSLANATSSAVPPVRLVLAQHERPLPLLLNDNQLIEDVAKLGSRLIVTVDEPTAGMHAYPGSIVSIADGSVPASPTALYRHCRRLCTGIANGSISASLTALYRHRRRLYIGRCVWRHERHWRH